jgi:hypothetical protein
VPARRPTIRDAPNADKVRLAVVRARLLITVVIIVVLTGTAVAIAHTVSDPSLTVNETPLAAGAPTALSLRTTFDRSTHGELSGVEVDLARGFRFDSRAAGVCSNTQAHAGGCPPASTIGRGTGTIVVQGAFLPRTPYGVAATFYLAKARHPGDIAGLVLDLYETESQLHATVLGRVVPLAHGAYGIALRFSDTDAQLPSGYTLSLLQLTSLLQAHRTASVNKRTVGYDLLTNPSSCTGRGWPVQLQIQSGGQPQVYHSTAPCSP